MVKERFFIVLSSIIGNRLGYSPVLISESMDTRITLS